MTDKRSYTAIVASIETHIEHINNHLQNIDGHLEKINTTNLEQEIKIALHKEEALHHYKQNKDRIGLGYGIGGAFFLIIIGIILKLAGIY